MEERMYIDPGSGSALLQAIIAFAVGGGLLFYRKIIGLAKAIGSRFR